jgi:L-fuconolactonase
VKVIVDAHQHFWVYGTYQTSWMEVPPYAGDPVFKPIRRSFQPDDLWPDLAAAGVRATITVEAADRTEENEALLTNAPRSPLDRRCCRLDPARAPGGGRADA